MTIRRFEDRLRNLERMVGATAANDAADLPERQALLAFLCDNDRAMTLYNEHLTALSLGSCPHLEIGACVSCWTHNQRSEKAQAALSALLSHIHAFQSPPATITKEQ